MSARSKKSAKKTSRRSKALDRPFDESVWTRAESVANQYQIILEPEKELGFIGHGLELPDVYGDGPTADECVSETREALTTAVASMIEAGERPPAPAVEGKRILQVNVRLTADEKLRLEEAARQHGFRSVSEFLRAAAFALPGILATLPRQRLARRSKSKKSKRVSIGHQRAR